MDKTKKILELVFNEATSDGEIINGVRLLRKEYKNGKLFQDKELLEEYSLKLTMFDLTLERKNSRIMELEDRLSSYATQIREKSDEVMEKIDMIEYRDRIILSLEEEIKRYKTWSKIGILIVTIFLIVVWFL